MIHTCNGLIKNKKDVRTIERKILITIDDMSLHRNHFIEKVRACIHSNLVYIHKYLAL